MASDQVKVGRFNQRDCWRTWFLEECEDSGLFGMTEKHRLWFKHYCRPGVRLYLEDAPHFRLPDSTHLLVGPYEITEVPVVRDGAIEEVPGGAAVIFKATHPERGPWFDRRRVLRMSGERVVLFDQKASDYGFFPFRFGIRRAEGFRQTIVRHGHGCHGFCNSRADI